MSVSSRISDCKVRIKWVTLGSLVVLRLRQAISRYQLTLAYVQLNDRMKPIRAGDDGNGTLRSHWRSIDGTPLTDAQWKLVCKVYRRVWQGINSGIIINETGVDKITFAKERTVRDVNRSATI